MTNEEAIAVLEESKRQNEIMRDNPTTFWKISDMEAGIENAKKRILALDAAISAIRHVSARQPLTMEQLRGMDGQPVWIMESPNWGHWELSEDAEDYLAGRDTSLYGITYPDHDCKGGVHQLRWIAYAYPPAHIDRGAWEPCSMCRPQENSLDRFSGHEFLIDDAEIYFCDSEDGWEGEEIRFCPWCGRPLTEAAWEELEKRVRGDESVF